MSNSKQTNNVRPRRFCDIDENATSFIEALKQKRTTENKTEQTTTDRTKKTEDKKTK